MAKQKLTAKRERFCKEYIKDLNATQAAIRAGYSENTATKIGSRLLTFVDVKERLSVLQQKLEEEEKVDANYIFKRLVQIDKMDVIDILNDDCTIKPITEWPPIWRQHITALDVSEISKNGQDQEVLQSVVKKIRWVDKQKNLEMLGKHIDIGAWKDKTELTGKDGKDLVQTVVVLPAKDKI